MTDFGTLNLLWLYVVQVSYEGIGLLWAAGEVDDSDFTLRILHDPSNDCFWVSGSRKDFAESAACLLEAGRGSGQSSSRFAVFVHDIAECLDEFDEERAQASLWN